ncbi:DUF5074 domain-containing protein [Petrimonas sp.]|uniref:DUF5074 domain-containing protein n=1 Tax=Petrimonas sp. TaxID=2023866 RepID=UPI003F51391E
MRNKLNRRCALPCWGSWRGLLLSFSLLILFSSCRKDVELLLSDVTTVDAGSSVNYAGLYLLNEGNMGSNKSTLDYFDFSTGTYKRNIYAEINPNVPKELGDVGNDLQVYGSRLYAVINASNKIEVMDARSARRIAQVDVPNCRYIAFHEGYAYVTSYAGPIEINPDYTQRGFVAKIDTATLQITDKCVVGFQPDGIAVSKGKIYVANSGGYMGAGNLEKYEKTVSVIDIATFREEKRIDVDYNLHRIKADKRENLWVTSRGNHSDYPSRLFFIDAQKQAVTDTFNIPVSNFWLDGDSLYAYSAERNTAHKEKISFSLVNTETKEIIGDRFITDGTDAQFEMPYGIMVHPDTKDIYITDAGDYVNPGYLYCFDKHGKRKWSVQTGDIPAHFALLPKK